MASSRWAGDVGAVVTLLAFLAGTFAESTLKTPDQMLVENNYPSEVYPVETEDGYIVRLDRIPNPGKPVVFIPNPILSAGSIFLHMESNYSLGYMLYDAGFDVFLGSDRGTEYSQDFARKYGAKFSPDTDEYFLFSWHEHGVYDNPAMMRKIIAISGQPQMTYIGFSMGCMAFLSMLPQRPELNSLIRSAHLMAPVTALGRHDSRLYELLHLSHNLTTVIADTSGIHRIPASLISSLTEVLCPDAAGAVCNNLVYFLFDSPRPIDYVGNCPDLTSSWPSGGSIRELLHAAQNTRYEGRFNLYDFGITKNLVKYGSTAPPPYKLENIVVPTYVYRGLGDRLVSDANAAMLQTRITGFKDIWVHPIEGFAHADFVWDHSAVIVYNKVLEDLRLYL